MGFLHDGVCHSTYNEAMSAKFGDQAMFGVHAIQGDKLHLFEYLNGVWQFVEYATNGGSMVIQYSVPVPVLAFPPCDETLANFIQPTPADIAYVFSWGFGIVVFFFFLGLVIGIAAKLIKEA